MLTPYNYLYLEYIDHPDPKVKMDRVCMALKGEEEGKIILGAFAMIDNYFYFDRLAGEIRIYKENCKMQAANILLKRERKLGGRILAETRESTMHAEKIILLFTTIFLLIFFILKHLRKGRRVQRRNEEDCAGFN